MTSAFDAARIRAILLDIEGTTTPVEFVTGELFPFARSRFREFLEAHANEAAAQADLASLRQEYPAAQAGRMNPPPWPSSSRTEEIAGTVAFVHWLMDRDSKCPPLKSLQGRIWQEGYASGALKGKVYPDVPRAFARWRAQGRDICIFSSGSVLAQKLLFGHSNAGDLTGFIRAWFDTTVGAKKEPESYRRIATELALEAEAILFVSDVVAELDAARRSGMQTVLAVRTGTVPAESHHPAVRSFDELLP